MGSPAWAERNHRDRFQRSVKPISLQGNYSPRLHRWHEIKFAEQVVVELNSPTLERPPQSNVTDVQAQSTYDNCRHFRQSVEGNSGICRARLNSIGYV